MCNIVSLFQDKTCTPATIVEVSEIPLGGGACSPLDAGTTYSGVVIKGTNVIGYTSGTTKVGLTVDYANAACTGSVISWSAYPPLQRA